MLISLGLSGARTCIIFLIFSSKNSLNDIASFSGLSVSGRGNGSLQKRSLFVIEYRFFILSLFSCIALM